jgi:hypothetical protein
VVDPVEEALVKEEPLKETERSAEEIRAETRRRAAPMEEDRRRRGPGALFGSP